MVDGVAGCSLADGNQPFGSDPLDLECCVEGAGGDEGDPVGGGGVVDGGVLPAEDDARVRCPVVTVAANPDVLYLRGLGCAVHASMLVELVFDLVEVSGTGRS